MKKRILFIIDSLTCGGAEKSLVSLLPLLSREKYDIYLWARDPHGAFMPLVPKDVHLVDAPRYNLLERVLLKIASGCYSIYWRVQKALGIKEHGAETLWKSQGWAMKVPEGKWDAVFAYQQGVPTYLVAEKFGFDTLTTGHTCKKFAWVNVNIFEDGAGYNLKFNNRFYAKFDKIVPVSEQLHELMLQKMPQFKDKYVLIYDILNPNMIREYAQIQSQKIKTSASEYVFVTTGRLSAQKGHDIAVAAAKELKDKGVKFKWYFVGEGSERPHIEQLIKDYGVKDNVILLGLRTNPYSFMTQADVYVQTSRFEGFGLTIAEAKILGKPIVSTNFDVVHNQLTHEKNGLIAEMNGKSVAENIYRMITDDALRSSIIAEVKKEKNTTYLTEAKKVESMIDE